MFQSDTNFIKFPHILSMLFIPTLHYDMLISVMYIYIYTCISAWHRWFEATPLQHHSSFMWEQLQTWKAARSVEDVEAKKRSAAVRRSWKTTQDLTIETLPSPKRLGISWDSWFISIGTWSILQQRCTFHTFSGRILMTQNWIEWRIGTLALTKRNPGKLGCLSNLPIHRTTQRLAFGVIFVAFPRRCHLEKKGFPRLEDANRSPKFSS